MSKKKGDDADVFLRIGIVLFGKRKELENIRDYLKKLEGLGVIKKVVFHTFSSEFLYILKDHLVKSAVDGDPEPIRKAFGDKVK